MIILRRPEILEITDGPGTSKIVDLVCSQSQVWELKEKFDDFALVVPLCEFTEDNEKSVLSETKGELPSVYSKTYQTAFYRECKPDENGLSMVVLFLLPEFIIPDSMKDLIVPGQYEVGEKDEIRNVTEDFKVTGQFDYSTADEDNDYFKIMPYLRSRFKEEEALACIDTFLTPMHSRDTNRQILETLEQIIPQDLVRHCRITTDDFGIEEIKDLIGV